MSIASDFSHLLGDTVFKAEILTRRLLGAEHTHRALGSARLGYLLMIISAGADHVD
ncbi:hypothetical protein D3C77_785620 [compost metagenome]